MKQLIFTLLLFTSAMCMAQVGNADPPKNQITAHDETLSPVGQFAVNETFVVQHYELASIQTIAVKENETPVAYIDWLWAKQKAIAKQKRNTMIRYLWCS